MSVIKISRCDDVIAKRSGRAVMTGNVLPSLLYVEERRSGRCLKLSMKKEEEEEKHLYLYWSDEFLIGGWEEKMYGKKILCDFLFFRQTIACHVFNNHFCEEKGGVDWSYLLLSGTAGTQSNPTPNQSNLCNLTSLLHRLALFVHGIYQPVHLYPYT